MKCTLFFSQLEKNYYYTIYYGQHYFTSKLQEAYFFSSYEEAEKIFNNSDLSFNNPKGKTNLIMAEIDLRFIRNKIISASLPI